MTLHTTKVVHQMHQLSVPNIFELRLLLTSKCTRHTYIARPLRI
ncbi:hypothetical protein F383_09145 [Gossypium arboreum]|uniref:Uncharacterized protein n=1 Tax=Gossypium arboreum TaxID=29729 RepID=A0A0B0PGJ3_GOSAR|nr:hypothetical protein F383_09145 [Gossypium arboreum]